ncbi:MAG: GGDEF domain-containing protein [Lachnospiraceae bacterium]|nr:GGDEF domain-containing protein [Lachnospiraceae bacterium]
MDFTNLVEQFTSMTCVLSVDAGSDGTYGNILVVTGNRAFRDEIENLTQKPFENNTPYYYSLPKDLNFEDFIYRSAILHEPLHTYVNLSRMGLWVEMYLLPLDSESKDRGFCLYSFSISPQVDRNRMSDLAPDTANAVLKSCIKLRGADDFLTAMHEVSCDIRAICGASRCTILGMNNDDEVCTILGNAHLPEFHPFPADEKTKRSFYKLMLTWNDTLAGSTCLIVKNKQDMLVLKERNPVWYESLSRNGVDSLALFPLKFNGQLLGYIWVTNFVVENAVRIKEVLELTTFFISSEIANYQMLKRLEILSTMDILTGTLNRNAMNNRVDNFDETAGDIKTLGIIFADLNGLKMVNDSNGHSEGDRFLKKTAAALRQIFVDDEIYRAGGDEFMILVPDNSREEFDEKVMELKEAQAKVNFAMGTCFQEGNIDIRAALRAADESMYSNKEKYYSGHPELKYR